MTKIFWPDGRIEESKPLNDMEIMAKQYCALRCLRDEYSDEMPQEIIHSASPNNKYKVRVGWWGNLSLRLSALEERGLLSDDLVQQYHQLVIGYILHLKKNKGLTRTEDINAANHLINQVMTSLESRLGPRSNCE
ncbi:hypothetical protein HYU07_01545 [Candidatus Woesearchaeota archaeon]|nr:hypothetical protein [Candidatus Woesearchaeota archaeon]